MRCVSFCCARSPKPDTILQFPISGTGLLLYVLHLQPENNHRGTPRTEKNKTGGGGSLAFSVRPAYHFPAENSKRGVIVFSCRVYFSQKRPGPPYRASQRFATCIMFVRSSLRTTQNTPLRPDLCRPGPGRRGNSRYKEKEDCAAKKENWPESWFRESLSGAARTIWTCTQTSPWATGICCSHFFLCNSLPRKS